MLIGRSAEAGRVQRVLDAARRGSSDALVLHGEPGVGKSALLRLAVERSAGLTVLEAHGFESESELPFAGLHELVRPLLDRVDALPGPQAAALRGALALAPQGVRGGRVIGDGGAAAVERRKRPARGRFRSTATGIRSQDAGP